MKIQEQIPLAKYTTFKIGGPAKFFCKVQNEEDVVEAVRFAKERELSFFVLGGGSNLLISDKGFNGLVIKMENKGVSYSGNTVTAEAGEIWDDFVGDTVSRGLFGLENLSLIPGTVGASVVQNIGAYGVDVSSVIESVRAFDAQKMEFISLSNSDCLFAYRDSIFKHQKGRYIVTSVTFKLEKAGKVNIEYRDLKEYFTKKRTEGVGLGEVGKMTGSFPTIANVLQAVIEIRQGKLPNWQLWGTAGSFFKNPILSKEQFMELKNKYPDLPSYPEPDGKVKIALAWILDKVCNVKDMHVGNAHVYEKQALVVVATAGATSAEVTELVGMIRQSVKEKTGLEIEAEVEWVN